MKNQIHKKIARYLLLCGCIWLATLPVLSAQIGTLTVNGDLELASSTSQFQLKDLTGAGTGHDQVVTTGNLTIAGTLEILLDGYTPNDMHFFEIITVAGTQTGSFSSITWPASMSTWSIDYGVQRPGKVTIYGPSANLPVEFVYFNAESHADYNLLSWQTASEQNNAYFEVEYSRDAKHFVPLTRVAGAGNSSTPMDYSYRHQTQETGIQYYRLHQLDWDGTGSYSDIVSLRRQDSAPAIGLYPNPTKGIIYFTEAVDQLQLYNQAGMKLLDIQEIRKSLDLTQLPSGLYFIQLNGAKERLMIQLTN